MRRWIMFRESKYLLVGNLTKGGAIATEDEYVSGAVGYAHLYEDGIIRRYGQEIGKREDIQDLGPADVEMSEEGEERLATDVMCILMGRDSPSHEHCEAVIASLERQLAWYRQEHVRLEAENARLKQDLRDLESNFYPLRGLQ